MFFAYDTSEDFEPLHNAGKRLIESGFTMKTRVLRAYCLIGHKQDTLEKAERRLLDCIDAGFFPMAMLYRDGQSEPTLDWRRFQRIWARPAIVAAKLKGGTP